MEPISVAMAAVAAIKSGVSLGKDISSLGSEVGKLWGAIDEINGAQKKKKKSFFRSVNEEALDTFMAKQKAKDLEDELRQIISFTRGPSAWQELLRLRGQIRKERQEEKEAHRRKVRKILEITVLTIVLVIGVGVLIAFVVALMAADARR